MTISVNKLLQRFFTQLNSEELRGGVALSPKLVKRKHGGMKKMKNDYIE
jgi:hypothetical protein